MPTGLAPSHLNFLHEHVYEGVWEKYNESAYGSRIWTLESHKVFFIMAALVVFAEFVGSRSWVIGRYVVLQMTGYPTRFPENAHSEPLLHLSQGKAMWSSFPSTGKMTVWLWTRLKRSCGLSTTSSGSRTPGHDPGQSVWFGIIAFLNLAFFMFMGVAIPVFLTDGALGAPVVKSKVVEECLTSDRVEGFLEYVLMLPATDAIFQQCFDEVNQACDSQYYFTSPQIETRRLDFCPFPGDVCQNQTKPFEISHLNVSAYEVGINSRAKLTLNHRLTCAPVVVQKFQLFPSLTPTYSFISARTTLDKPSQIWTNFSARLSTVNGPNSLTNKSSGLQMAMDDGPLAVVALPRFKVPLGSSISKYQELIHENLWRDDGQSFLIVFAAGRSQYFTPVDDPLFAAHNEYNPPGAIAPRYLPDYEATALGCIEQYQLCIPRLSGPIFCTKWGHKTQHFDELETFLDSGQAGWDQGLFAVWEKNTVFLELTRALAVYDFIAIRNQVHDMATLLRDQTSMTRSLDSEVEPWIVEVDTWFRKAIMDSIFRVRTGARYHFADVSRLESDPELKKAFIQDWATCGRVLFRDADYTNINWIGFCATAGALSLLCFLSYLVERIHKCGISLCEALAHPYATIDNIRSISGLTMRYLRRHVVWKPSAIVNQLSVFFQTYWFSDVSGVRTAWYGHQQTHPSASSRGSNENNIPVAHTMRQDLNEYDLDELHDFDAIDNPI